jgi:hypothetical protein
MSDETERFASTLENTGNINMRARRWARPDQELWGALLDSLRDQEERIRRLESRIEELARHDR